jgi:hypothetical protein
LLSWRPTLAGTAQPTSKKPVKIPVLDLRQRTAAQDCLLESATLNESAIMPLPVPRIKAALAMPNSFTT